MEAALAADWIRAVFFAAPAAKNILKNNANKTGVAVQDRVSSGCVWLSMLTKSLGLAGGDPRNRIKV